MGHDQRFKELLKLFLKPFLEHFFPDAASRLDLSSPEFVDKELFEDPPEGSHRVADLVARVATHSGEPELILVHIEVQADKRGDVPARMFEYYALLRRTYRLPILPLVLYLRGGGAPLHQEEHVDDLFGVGELVFRYPCVVLSRFDAEEHVRASGDALLTGLAALMDRSRVQSLIGLRLSMLDRIGRSTYDDYRKFLLTHLVEVYFELRENERERFEKALSRPELREAKKMAISYVDKIMEEGRNEGLLRGKQDTFLRLLRKKFVDVPDVVNVRIQAIASVELLDALIDQVLESSSLDELDFPE